MNYPCLRYFSNIRKLPITQRRPQLSLKTQYFFCIKVNAKFSQYCAYYNYPVEEHIIQTQDKYNLKFFRIQKKNTKITKGKKVVYLQHGLIDSSDTFIINQEKLAPGLVLANKGYDVWFGNIRGNKYSNQDLSPQIKSYWSFSFDEMAEYDLPAALKYIRRETQRKINYIGHSQGSMIMLAALSMKYPQVQESLNSFCAWAPVAYLSNVKSKALVEFSKRQIIGLMQKAGDKIILLMTDRQLELISFLCKNQPKARDLILKQLCQEKIQLNNLERFPIFLGHFPAGTSLKNFIHFEQLVNNPYFRKFNYSEQENMKKYQTQFPPDYELKNINFPVHLLTGVYDKLSTPVDCLRLWDQLQNSPKKTFTELQYGHATFIWGKSTEHITLSTTIIEAQAEKQ